jgi:energy-coupling factor transport system permease protein
LSKKNTAALRLDPRTKLFVLLIGIAVVIFTRRIFVQCGFILLLTGLGILCGKWRVSLTGILVYAGIRSLIWYAGYGMTGTVAGTMLVAGLGFFTKIFPSGMAAGILLSTTNVSELLAAAVWMRIPRKIYIPMAVMCRYFPVVREDWRYIRGAMKLRGIYLSPKGFFIKPAMTVECLYVPLMMSASKAADELSAAAVSRGIENPQGRTCFRRLAFSAKDFMVMMLFGITAAGMFFF